MKEFFEFIKARIETIGTGEGAEFVPAFRTIRMFNNQFIHSNGDAKDKSKFSYRDEKAFKYPACFIEFIVNEVNNLPLGIKDYLLTVRFRFGVEGYKLERLDTFDFCDQFLAGIQGMVPSDNTLCFTSFQEVSTEFDEDHNNVEMPYIDYRTRYRSQVSYSRRTDVLAENITTVVIGEI
jgi:hypothetical protein